jgi:two-component system, sensor histidine kinase and response regulator
MSKASLLLVEDEPNLLLAIRDILELDDYQVNIAQNGREALNVLEEAGDNLPDLIVSDIMMPYLNGLDFLKEVRKHEHWVRIPFIFLTAKGSKEDVQQGKLLGVDDYLIKPFDADDLLVAVESRLERHRALHHAQEGAISSVKRNILTILNHEFRTPLTLVVAYADMLKDNDIENMSEEELLMFLKEINSGASRLRRLIENFIILVELETGDAAKTYEWRKNTISDVDRIVQAALDRYVEDPKVSHICEMKVTQPVPAIEGDSEFLMNLVSELINNAIKFSEEETVVQVEVLPRGDELHISVSDQGRGINESKLKSIWDIFYQAERELHEDQGAGSGLAIVQGLTELHNGHMEVQSEPGKGSCFTLILPTVKV